MGEKGNWGQLWLRHVAFGLIAFAPFASGMADENSWSTSGPYGGTVFAIACHPFDPQILYASTFQYGIYKTTNRGESWQYFPADSLQDCPRTLAIHPLGPDTMLMGTDHGMFKSIDGGISWRLMRPPYDVDGMYYAVAVHPLYPNVVFGDKWKSTDSGENWYQMNITPQASPKRFSVDLRNSNIMYFVSSDIYDGHGVWKSEDMGDNWHIIQNNIPQRGTGEDIAVDPLNNIIVYLAVMQWTYDSTGCIYRSSDGGRRWYDATPDILNDGQVQELMISPSDHNVVFAGTHLQGVLKSTNAGQSWAFANEGLGERGITTMQPSIAGSDLFLGTYSCGVYKSSDDGASWATINNGICATDCNEIAINRQDPSLIYVAAVNGLFRSSDAGESWNLVQTNIPPHSNIISVASDDYLPQSIYTTVNPLYPDLSDSAGFYCSTDGGMTWTRTSNGLPGDRYYRDIAISYLGPDDRRFFLASDQGLFFSDDIVAGWSLCEDSLNNYVQIFSIAVAENDPNTIAIADEEHNVFLTTDRGGIWWRTADFPYYPWGYLEEVKIDPLDARHLYVTGAPFGILEYVVGDERWSSPGDSLPQDPRYPATYGLAINPLDPSNLFVSSLRMGVYQSHDGGQSWDSFNNGLDTAGVYGHLLFPPGDSTRLYVTSYGRSVWSIHRTPTGIADDRGPRPQGFRLLQNYPNPFNGRTIIRFSLPRATAGSLAIYNISGQLVRTVLLNSLKAGVNSVEWDAADESGEPLGSGVYFARLKAAESSATIKLLLLK